MQPKRITEILQLSTWKSILDYLHEYCVLLKCVFVFNVKTTACSIRWFVSTKNVLISEAVTAKPVCNYWYDNCQTCTHLLA